MDPLSPPPPREVVFDSGLGMWVLSRYADVLAAMREPALRPVSAKKSKNVKVPDESALRDLRARVVEALSPVNLDYWQARIERAAAELPAFQSIDLVSQFAEPLCAAAAEIVTGAKFPDRERLLDLAKIVSRAAAGPFDENLRIAATRADAELEEFFADAVIPLAASTFVALACTIPRLLANGWLALFRHPDALAELHKAPQQIPRAVEEILRYACVPQMVFRYVPVPLMLCGREFPEGERLVLRLASANRDPRRFSDPGRFYPARPEVSHLTLGFGPHACAGGALIRMVAATATGLFVERFVSAQLTEKIEWQGGPGFQSVSALWVR